MTHLTHPTKASLELAAERALASAEEVLGAGLRDDPAEAVGALLLGLRFYCLKRAGGSASLIAEAMGEFTRLEDLVEDLDELEASKP
ncbi:hypothetical protein [Singulisphaera sp. PoT]|uniref:hypothetical protein n=1 Tax=Singulisphaera sp. PoT TaxID=3411797 RepID=UPI003BF6114B